MKSTSISSSAAERGSVSSHAKTVAARNNGQLGGRPSPYRRVTMQRDYSDRIYRVPDTGHWAGWRDADAVVFHGELVAIRRRGKWEGAEDTQLSRNDIARYAQLKSVGISTR